MRLLALSDLHADEELLDRLRAISSRQKYDAVLFCGDITNRGPVSYAEEVVSLFPRAYAVHGNMDTPDVVDRLREMGVLVHGKKVKMGEWNLVGLGGSNPTPFGTPSELSEDEIASVLARAGVDDFSIVLSHPPPYGLFDEVGNGMHVGSKAVRKMVEEKISARVKSLINDHRSFNAMVEEVISRKKDPYACARELTNSLLKKQLL